MSEADEKRTDEAEQPDAPEFRVEGVEPHSGGRITIPSRFRHRYDIEGGDIVDVQVEAGTEFILAFDLEVSEEGRIRIPDRKRKIYDLSDGEPVNLNIAVTGMSMDDDE